MGKGSGIVGNWHEGHARDVLARLQTHPNGLTQRQAEQRLAKYGRNELDKPKGEGLFLRLLRQLS